MVERTAPGPRRHFSKLPKVHGFERVADQFCADGTWRRMLKCEQCGEVIPSLGVGYHLSRRDHRH